MEIGFIGLGNMGSGMAVNLVKAGHQVFAFDLNKDALARAVSFGCVGAQTAEAAAKDVIITMLPAGAHVRELCIGGLFETAKKGTLFIDCSTIDIESARVLNDTAQNAGHDFVDAPVSGGVAAANAGTLTFMVGGSDTNYARAKPILENMGQKIFHAGAAGNGQAAKICNNMLLGITMIGTSEAFVLAQKLGLSAQTFFDISSVSSGQNWSMTSYCPVAGPVPTSPANRDYQAGFSAAMMLKDLRLANDAAQNANAQTPLGEMAKSLYEEMEERGMSATDFSGVIKLLD